MKSVRKTIFLCLLATASHWATAAPPEPKAPPAGKTEWELWLPPSGKTVTAVFVCPRWGDGANMAKIIQTNLGESLGVATLLTREDKLTFKEDHFGPSIARTLSAAAVERNHPELAHAPLLLWSHSNAAAYVQRCLREFPERIIAYCLFKSAFGHNNDLGTGPALETPGYGYKSPVVSDTQQQTMSKAATQVLGQGIWDMNDRINSPGYNQDHERTVMLKNMADARKQGALVHVAMVRGTHHMIDGQQELMLSFFKTAMAMRLAPNTDAKKGPVKLTVGLEERGLLQDGATRSIHSDADYPSGGNRREGWWLPSRDYAVLWNNYALNAKGTVVAPAK
jgi:hypothetical protein